MRMNSQMCRQSRAENPLSYRPKVSERIISSLKELLWFQILVVALRFKVG